MATEPNRIREITTAPTHPPSEVRVEQIWAYQDGEVRRQFRVTSVKNKYGRMCVFGVFLGTGKFIGSNWTATKLLRGYRGAVLVRDAFVAPYVPERAPEPKERAPKKAKLSLPRGMTRSSARQLVERATVRHGRDARAIASEVGFSPVVVEALLGDARTL